MKPGPIVAMAGLLLLGMWLVTQPYLARRAMRTPGAVQMTLGVAGMKVGVEQREGAAGHEYRVLEPGAGEWMSGEAFAREVERRGRAWESRGAGVQWLMSVLNVSSLWNVAWIAVGLAGQACFFLRMMVQWVASERERRSHIPEVFWWLSLAGGVSLFAYFVWRVDVVGVLGQSTGIVVYARNLRLIRKQARGAV